MRSAAMIALSVSLWLGLSGQLSALEAVGKFKSVDVEKGVVVVFANGQDRQLKIDANVKVLDAEGKDLAGGLKAEAFKEGAEVTVTVDRGQNGMMLTAIRLGAIGGKGSQPRPDGNRPRPATLEAKTSVGFKPLTEMSATDAYKGEDGGLYGGGKNEPTPTHAAAAKKETAKIVPLDREGKPAKDGKIVLISISMSNATQEFSKFVQIVGADQQKSPDVKIVDCAQGGQTMARWKDPNANCWSVAMQRLSTAGVTPEQVQVCWVKLANAGPSGDLNQHGKILYDDTVEVLHLVKSKFPNIRIAYLGSRIYGGYAGGNLNPEPYAYEGAFIVRRLIQDQIASKGDLSLEHSPLLLWGPYFWGDGMTPRKSDGLIWERDDLASDGTHPSESGRTKVADMLLSFFKSDADAKTWFVGK
jgi:hypothetical protein